MTIPLQTKSLPVRSALQTLPYAPSWIDRLTDWVARLPGPVWTYYLLMASALVLLDAVLEWRAGSYPVGTFYPLHVVTCVTGIAYLALIHYLDRVAGRALDKFHPLFDDERGNLGDVRYRLTTMPAPTVRWVTAFGVVYGLGLTYIVYRGWAMPTVIAFESPLTSWLNWIVIASTNMMMVLFIYHTVHQLRVINEIYVTYTKVDIFHLSPLYALAGLAGRTALGWSISACVWLLAMPAGAPNTFVLVNSVAVALLGLVAFVWPLTGIHILLEDEKIRHQVAVRRRVQVAMDELHRRIDSGQFDATQPIVELLGGLKQEVEIIDQIPTWPWQPELFRTVLSAVLLPVALWFITRLIERFVAF